MKCSKCGYRATDIAHMAAHYRKKHPKAMAKKKDSLKFKRGAYTRSDQEFIKAQMNKLVKAGYTKAEIKKAWGL